MTERKKIIREPFPIVTVEQSDFKETYGGAEDVVVSFCMLLRSETPSDTCLVTMHPIGGTGWMPVMGEFVRRGIHVLACDGRYRGVDSALNMEKVTLDLGNAVRHAREKLGYKHVVLLGWSGGGSLSAFYQSQAESPTVTGSPCGGGPDLTRADLLPADALILMAAHVSRHGTLTQWMDASITDEANPEQRDASLDLYGGEVAPPYTEQFLETYRAAQIARNRRITAWVRHKLQELADRGRENEEFAFVTHGTMAAPCWLDPAVDPNDRRPGWCYLGDPRVVNNGPVGLARFSTLRSWLSQWSYDDANADGPRCLARVSTPVLVVGNSADDACTPSHTRALFNAVGHDNKAVHEIQGATHYYLGQPELAGQSADIAVNWLGAQGLI
ncbi:MAG: alpha/beta fold hydrolase [Gammaproteobacteria bacterium AqS3]|nr:alpha/beta fold hydrolase [Gammaproteobacteria bacterium AqS3]